MRRSSVDCVNLTSAEGASHASPGFPESWSRQAATRAGRPSFARRSAPMPTKPKSAADPEAVAALVRPDVPELWTVVEALVRIIDDASPPRLGSDLAFAREEDRVVLELHVPAGDDDQATLVRVIEAGYAAHLRQYPEPRAVVIREHLAIRVLPYGVRVS